MKSEYRSDLSKAKNLGAAGSGSHHWWHQRLTAIIISLMILWVISFFGDISKSNITTAISHLRKPFNTIMLLILFFTVMYHAVLGMQVVIEDYISCRAYRFVLVVGIQIFAIITAISFAFAAFYVMIL
ncbi:MAG: succinate dehydrogenase, hydrophobic membrane anchor protein [Candidatus Megaira endosymbiont of Mesostigma viride]|jgi:succinate dehydrogenase / fumarate reductase membrane anchor subunit|nr:MAG: succinate dehydrogenase, hydrophobic membrane anchor protein [Candidatus Megaira endosymbiont of Mesostigma viride]HJK88565.1 succinate dehydrogenase, hydrophobic membrane anchor protein [Candidatus Megaira endosymbiont of Mesostigma viride]